MIMRTSSGVDLYKIDITMELIMTLLPAPVDPTKATVSPGATVRSTSSMTNRSGR